MSYFLTFRHVRCIYRLHLPCQFVQRKQMTEALQQLALRCVLS
jgi:hypothetical protein